MSKRLAEPEQLKNDRAKRPNTPDISTSQYGTNESPFYVDKTPVTDGEIYEVTKDLGPDELQHLFHNLGIAQHDIDNEERAADTKDPRLRAIRVLHFWRQTKGNEATRVVLHQAREKAQQDDAHNWREELKVKYKLRPTIRFGRHRRAEADTDDIFVDLTLLEEKKKDKGRTLKSYHELFHDLENGVGRAPVNGILLQGPAGIGKSTLLSKFAYLWANEYESNDDIVHASDEMRWEEFKLVFLIKLKSLKDGESLEKTIVNQLLPDVSEKQITSVLTKLGSKCLILLDGYDEIPKDVSEYALKSSLLCKCRVIVTTRPHLVDQFHQDDDRPKYADVKISGFSSENSKKYIQKFFKCNNQLNVGEDLIEKIEEIPYSERFSSHPILLVMLCLLWLNADNREYQVYSWTVLFENAVKYLNKPFQTKYEMPSDVLENVLLELGKPALEAMFEDAVQIRSAKYDKETLKKGFLIGLLVEEEGYHISDALVNFIHKTFQEFCAAKYLVYLAESNNIEFKNMLDKINLANLFDMEYVLLFCCGLSIDAAKVIIPHAVGLIIPVEISEAYSRGTIIPFLMLYESEIYNTDNPNEAIKSLHNELVPVIKHGTGIESVEIYMSEDLIYYLKGSLDLSHINCITLSYLALSCNNNSRVWLNHIQSLIVSYKVSINTLMRLLGCLSSVQLVKLNEVELDGEHGEIDENISVSCTSVNKFEIKSVSLSANRMMRLLRCMPSVVTITLRDVQLNGNIDNTLVQCTSVTKFTIWDGSVSANTILNLLGCMPSVKSVELYLTGFEGGIDENTSISCASLTEFALSDASFHSNDYSGSFVSLSTDSMMRLLECMPSVQSVIFQVKRLSGEIDENILVSCTSLTFLALNGFSVSANTLTRLLKCMPSVKSIKLCKMTIKGDIDENASISCASVTEFTMSYVSVSANTIMRLFGCMTAVKSVTLESVDTGTILGGEEDDILESCKSLTSFHLIDSSSSIVVSIMARILECKSLKSTVTLSSVEITDSDGADVLGYPSRATQYIFGYYGEREIEIEEITSESCASFIKFIMTFISVSASTLVRLLRCMSSVKSETLEGEIAENTSTSLTELTMYDISVSANSMMRLLECMPLVKSVLFKYVKLEGEVDENIPVYLTSLTKFTMRDVYVSPNTLMRLLGCMPALELVTLDTLSYLCEVVDNTSVSFESLTSFHLIDISITIDIMMRLLECMSPRAIVELNAVQITDSDGVDVLGWQNETRNEIVWFWRASTLITILQRHTQ